MPKKKPSESRSTDSNKAVVDGTLCRISCSQIETFKSCARKWAFDKVFGVPRGPDGAGAIRGKDGHKEIEKYLLTGEDTRTEFSLAGAEMLEPYVEHAPFKGGIGLVECRLKDPIVQVGGVTVDGYIDYFIPILTKPVIIDHKFKSDPKKYPVDLENDTQAIIYSYWAIQKTGAAEAEFRHHTHKTKGKLVAIPTSAHFTRDLLLEKVSSLGDFVKAEMAPVAGVAHQDEVPYNQKSCWSYGGCPYASVCNKSPMNNNSYKILTTQTIEGETMKIKDAVAGKTYKLADGKTVKFGRELGGLYKFADTDGNWLSKKADEPLYNEADVIPAASEPVIMRPEVAAEAKNPTVLAPEPKKEKWGKGKKESAPVVVNSPLEVPAAPRIAVAKDLVLLVDVVLVGVGTDINGYIADIYASICRQFKVEDVRLGDPNGPLGFGKWKGVAAALARANPPQGLCFVRSGELADPVIEALRPMAIGSNI